MLDWVQAPGETEATRTKYTYDDLYRTTKVSKYRADVTYTYQLDLLNTIDFAGEMEYDFDYGAFNLVSSVKVGERTLINHVYSDYANRYLTDSVYGNGDSIFYAYDIYGRMAAEGETGIYAAMHYLRLEIAAWDTLAGGY